MSYLVLARKWRPSTFDEVVGQQHVTRTLKNAIVQDRVAHALLFTGSRGVGKTSCARILAKALNCAKGPTVDPCGECPSCLEIGGGTSVDVFEIDGASNNGVEQIRELRESVKFLPTRGKRKMYIIDEVHMLSTSAFNALLKTLEEPPEHVLFVFATTEPHKIPDTIISRCQRYDFKRIPERDIVEAIGRIAAAEGLSVEAAALTHIAREAKGGMRDSLSLLDQVIAFCGHTITEAATRDVLGIADRRTLADLTLAIVAGDGARALAIVDDLHRFGLDLQKFAAEFVHHLRDLMVVKVVESPGRLVDLPGEEIEAMAAQVSAVPPAAIHRLFNAMLQGADEIARSPFPKLVLEMSLLRLCQQGVTLPLAEVLDGLARLEARLDAEVPPDDPPPGAGGGVSGGGGGSHAGAPVAPAAASAGARAQAPDVAPPALSPPAIVPPPSAEAARAPAPPVAAPAPSVHGWRRPDGERPDAAPTAAPTAGPMPSAAPTPPPPTRATPPPPSVGAPAAAVAPEPVDDGVVEIVPLDIPDHQSWTCDPPPPIQVTPPRPPALAAVAQADAAPRAPRPAPRPALAAEVEAEAEELEVAEPLVALDLADGRRPMAHFEHLVTQFRRWDAFLAAEVEQTARLETLTADALCLAVPQSALEALQPAVHRLEQAVQAMLAPTTRVQVRGCPDQDERLAGETLFARKQRLAHERRERRRAQARQDPVVQGALRVFGAQIIDINPRD